MLTQLRIHNYALISDLSIDLRPGFTVLTGETGAGKSIIIGAMSLLTGEKPEPDMIRSGTDAAVVEGRFENAHASAAACAELGIDASDGTLILRRRAERTGRGMIHANDSAVTVSGLKAIGEVLVDLHGQHQHQLLLKPQVHLDLLDAYAGLIEERRQFTTTFEEHRELKEELIRLSDEVGRRRERRELAKSQWQEIADANLKPGLVAELNAERALLQSTERRYALAARLAAILSEQDGSISELLAAARKILTELVQLDPALNDRQSTLTETESAMNDLWREVISYRDAVEFSAERLEDVNARLFRIEKLERKHRTTADRLLTVEEELRRELDSLEIDESRILEISRQAEELEHKLQDAAAAISRRRRKAGVDLERKLAAEFESLGLAGARFHVAISEHAHSAGVDNALDSHSELTPTGADVVEFLFSANAGEELRPLRKVASGGELSRIMLGLKTVLAAVDPVPVMVFDEIDTGIGGRVAEAVGRRLSRLGRSRQVICITHLPQIARHADDHLLVLKINRAGRTTTSLRRLDDEGRVAELARMSGGETVTAANLAAAREMLKTARERS